MSSESKWHLIFEIHLHLVARLVMSITQWCCFCYLNGHGLFLMTGKGQEERQQGSSASQGDVIPKPGSFATVAIFPLVEAAQDS